MSTSRRAKTPSSNASSGSHRGGEQDDSGNADAEGTGEEERPAPGDEAGVVLQQAVVHLRHDQLDGTAACTRCRRSVSLQKLQTGAADWCSVLPFMSCTRWNWFQPGVASAVHSACTGPG